LKALDLIARLSALQQQYGNCEVWLEMDLIAPSADVEMWHRPFFDECTFIILATRRSAQNHPGKILPFSAAVVKQTDNTADPEA
jgi:hypothetical protein